MILPQRLRKGDLIGVVCPSMPIYSMDKFHKGLDEIRKLGLETTLGSAVDHESGFMAGDDAERAADLNAMFARSDVRAVFCGVGGESAIRLLSRLDYDQIARSPKIFMGFSDITILLHAIHAKTGLVTFHGPNVEYGFDMAQIQRPGLGEYTRAALLKTLFAAPGEIVIRPKQAWKTLKPGRAAGRLLGGNLECVRAVLNTPHLPTLQGSLFFWEELYTTPATLDIRLREFQLRGVFDQISGMIIGKNWKCYNHGYRASPTVEQVVLDAARGYDFPILTGVDFGHNCDQCILPVGAEAVMDTERQEIRIRGPVVA